jgi:hypothetical protein
MAHPSGAFLVRKLFSTELRDVDNFPLRFVLTLKTVMATRQNRHTILRRIYLTLMSWRTWHKNGLPSVILAKASMQKHLNFPGFPVALELQPPADPVLAKSPARRRLAYPKI